MRIAVWHNLPAGGAKRALYGHVLGLQARGHEIEAWCPPTADRSFLPLDQLVPEHVVEVDAGDPPWWKGNRVGLLQSPRSFARGHMSHARECAAQMRARGFDICLASTDWFFGSPPIGRYLDFPGVLYLQEPHRWLYEAYPTFPWMAPGEPTTKRQRLLYPARSVLEAVRMFRRGQRVRVEVDNAQSFTRVLVNSTFSRETVLRSYGLDAEVCYLGVDPGRFMRLERVPRENMVLGVGAFAPHKRPHLLVEAVGRVAGPRPRVEWIAPAQDKQYADRVLAAARTADVELTVHLGATDESLVNALNRARALVYVPQLEPFGLVPLEANACGLPVIGAAEGGVRETVVDGVNGLLVAPEASAIATAIERLVSDDVLARDLGDAGHRLVMERWSEDAAASRLEAALRETLNN